MKLLLINGSPRKNGSTSKILNELFSVLNELPNVDLELIDLSDLDMKFCTGCCSCYTTGKCFIDDDLENLSQKINLCDGLIIGSPTYASNVSGHLKVLFDRGHFVIEQLLYKKYSMSITTFENYGGKDASRIINRLLSYSGAQISSSIILKLPFSNDPLNDAQFKNSLIKEANKIYTDILNSKPYFFQKIKHYIIFNFGIKPFVKSKGLKYKGVVDRWNLI